MNTVKTAKDSHVVIYFMDGATREVKENSSVYLYENGMVRVILDGLDEFYLPHVIKRIVFPEHKEKPKRPRVMMG